MEINWKIEEEEIDLKLPPLDGKERIEFSAGHALAVMVINDILFINNNGIHVICSDTFYYACADVETIELSEIEELYRMWRKDPTIGSIAFCVKRRKLEPIPQVVKYIKEAGFDIDSWDLEKNSEQLMPRTNHGSV